MVTPVALAEMIEGEDVMDAESIEDTDRECPECGEDVLEVGYMPSVTEFVTGWKCQECDWSDTDRE
jgi:ribosomal protein S27AE